MLTNLPIPYDLCIRVPIYYFLRVTICLAYCLHSVLNVKALVGAYCETDGSFYSTTLYSVKLCCVC